MIQPSSLAQFKQVLQDHKVVVVDAFATWCGPCKWIAPKFQFLDENYGVKKFSDAQFVKVDVDQTSDIAQFCKITAMPTFIIYVNGNESNRIMGANYKDLKSKIENTLRSELGEQFRPIENDPHETEVMNGGATSIIRILLFILIIGYLINQYLSAKK